MNRSLFVPYEDVLEVLGGIKGVIDVEDGPARVTEDVLDAFFFKTADNDFRAGDFHCFFLSTRHSARRPQCGSLLRIETGLDNGA
jgi:hypothetical protein